MRCQPEGEIGNAGNKPGGEGDENCGVLRVRTGLIRPSSWVPMTPARGAAPWQKRGRNANDGGRSTTPASQA